MLVSLVAVAVLLSQAAALTQSLCSTQNTGSGFAEVFNQFQSNGACSQTCQTAGYYLAVVQDYDCWCTNYAPSTTVSLSNCSDECPGFPDELCGSLANKLFGYIELPGYTPVSTSSSAKAASSSATPVVVVQPSTLVVTSVNTVVSTQVNTVIISPSAPDPVTVVETTTAQVLITTSILLITTRLAPSSSTPTPTPTSTSTSTTTSSTTTTTSTSTSTPIPIPIPTPTSTSTTSVVIPTSTPQTSISSSAQAVSSAIATPIPVTSIQIVTLSGAVVTQYITTTPSLPASTGQSQSLKQTSNAGLSNGAVAGITIGAVAGAALLGALLFLCCRRRRQNADAEEGSGIARNTSVLSRVGLLRGSRQRAPLSPHPLQSAGAMTEVPSSPRALFVDTRLNPHALMNHTNASKTSVGTLQDDKDYSRPLEVRNPDAR